MAEWETAFDKLKAAYAAWHDSKGASIDAWVDLVDEDGIDFRSLANGMHGVPWARSCACRDEVRGYLAGLTQQFAMEHFTLERFVCQDDTIVAITHTAWRNRASGKRIDTPKIDVWRFKDGKAVAFHEYYDTANIAAAAAP